MNTAMALTIFRILLSPVFALAIYTGSWRLAFITIGLAIVTDISDGYIARRFKQETPLGKFLDPLADKLLFGIGFIFLVLTYHLPLYYFLAITRDILIGFIGLYLFFTKRKKKKLDFTASFWGKATTVLQATTMLAIMLYVIGMNIAVPILDVLVLLTFILSVISTWHYLVTWVKKGYL